MTGHDDFLDYRLVEQINKHQESEIVNQPQTSNDRWLIVLIALVIILVGFNIFNLIMLKQCLEMLV